MFVVDLFKDMKNELCNLMSLLCLKNENEQHLFDKQTLYYYNIRCLAFNKTNEQIK